MPLPTRCRHMLEGTFSDYCENYCEVLLTSLVPSHRPHPQSCCCEDVVLPRTAARRGSRPELGWLYNLKPGSGADLVTSPGHWTWQNKATRRGHVSHVFQDTWPHSTGDSEFKDLVEVLRSWFYVLNQQDLVDPGYD